MILVQNEYKNTLLSVLRIKITLHLLHLLNQRKGNMIVSYIVLDIGLYFIFWNFIIGSQFFNSICKQ